MLLGIETKNLHLVWQEPYVFLCFSYMQSENAELSKHFCIVATLHFSQKGVLHKTNFIQIGGFFLNAFAGIDPTQLHCSSIKEE